jgi:hypothetical protein
VLCHRSGGYIANNTVDNFYYCVQLCKNVNSDRNCICNACGGVEYPVTQINDTAKAMLGDEVCMAYLGNLDASSWSLLPSDLSPPAGVQLTYGNGEGGSSTSIRFVCDPKQSGITAPSFTGVKNNVYSFDWYNAAACPSKQ